MRRRVKNRTSAKSRNSADTSGSSFSERDHRAHLRRAMIASTVGTTFEWYDFLLYGQVTALVFGKLFFPKSDPLVGVLEAFAVFFYRICRPADRSGDFRPLGRPDRPQGNPDRDIAGDRPRHRRRGSRPDLREHRHLGCRSADDHSPIQGIGVGGEWGGSVLLAMELARTDQNRGFIASWQQFGAPAGFFLANLAVLVFSWLSGDEFLVWGWCIPFLISIVMVGVGLWIRGILETPVFQKVLDEERVECVPVLQVLKRQPKEVVLTALLRLPEQAPGYIFGAFVFTYGTTVLGQSRNFMLIGVLVQAVLARVPVDYSSRASVGPHRPKKYVHHRLPIRRNLRFCLLCHARQPRYCVNLCRRRPVGAADHDDVRSRGGIDRGELLAPAAL